MTPSIPENQLKSLQTNFETLQQEKALLEQELTFSKFSHDMLKTTISVTDLETGTYLYVNKAFCELTGFSQEEVLGKNGLELGLWKPQERQELIKALNKYQQIQDIQFHVTAKSGGTGIALGAAKLIEVDGKPAILLTAKDITQEQKTKLKHQEQNQEFSALLDNMISGVALFSYESTQGDAQWRLLYANACFYKLTQAMGPAFLLEKGPLEMVPGLNESHFKQLLHVTLSGESLSLELACSRTQKYYQLNLFRPRENTLALLLLDITQRKEGEQVLEQAKREAEQIATIKSDFLATISHELRTPLNGIMGMTSLLESANLPAEHQEYIHLIHLCSDNLLNIINDIISFSNSEYALPEGSQVHLLSLVERALELAAEKRQQKPIEFFYTIEPSVPVWLEVDQAKLLQILQSLLSNAVKFSEFGNIEVRVHTKEIHDPIKQIVEFQVIDQGHGIASNQLERIFEPFSQGENPLNRQFGGTGLGLALSKKLVELLGGQITIQSQHHHGTTVSFTLPIFKTEPASQTLPVLAHFPGTAVLILDCNPSHGKFLQGLLESLGCQCNLLHPLQDMQLTPDFLQHHQFIVVNDPELYGFQELYQKILLQAQSVKIPILRCGGIPLAQKGEFALKKPIYRVELHNTVQLCLNASQPQEIIKQVHKKSKSPHVLIAEDNELNQLLFSHLVTDLGFLVDQAKDGEEAIEFLGQKPYQMIILDIEMPKMDGFQVAEWIQMHLPPDKKPIILGVTAHDFFQARDRLKRLGFERCLSKPINPNELKGVIQEILTAPTVL